MCIIDENEIFNKYLRQGDFKNGETLEYGDILRSVWKKQSGTHCSKLVSTSTEISVFYPCWRRLWFPQTLSYGVPPPTLHSVCGNFGHPSLRVPVGYILNSHGNISQFSPFAKHQ